MVIQGAKLTGRDKWVPVTTAWSILKSRMKDGIPICTVDANIMKRQSWTFNKVWSSISGLSEVLITLQHTNVSCYEMFTSSSDLD